MFDIEIRKGGAMFEKDMTIRAKMVDESNPFFVVISGIEKPLHSTTLELPDDKAYEKFSQYKNIKLPNHQIGFIGEIEEDKTKVLSIVSQDETKMDQ